MQLIKLTVFPIKIHQNCFIDAVQMSPYKIYFVTSLTKHYFSDTPQPLYNTIVWAQANFSVRFQNHVIMRAKRLVIYIEKKSKITNLQSNSDPCCIQNHVITNHGIKRLRCILFFRLNSYQRQQVNSLFSSQPQYQMGLLVILGQNLGKTSWMDMMRLKHSFWPS